MPVPAPQHGAVFVQELLRDLAAQGIPPGRVLAGSGLAPAILQADRPSAPFDAIARVFENAAEITGEDCLGFRRGLRRDMRSIGLLCYVGLAAPRLRDVLKNIERYRRVFSDAVEFDTSSLDRDGRLRWYFGVSAQVRRRQYVEFGASGLLQGLRQATNRDLRLQGLCFRHARRTGLAEFERFFGCAPRFAAAENMMQFRQADLDLPLITADDKLCRVLVDHCDLVLRDKSRNTAPLVVSVERAIADRLTSGSVSQEAIARALGMSPRTLSRRLAQENTSFFATLEGFRAAMADRYLRHSDLSLSEIAFLLGYSGQSSFTEAFKRWTGTAPGRYRAG